MQDIQIPVMTGFRCGNPEHEPQVAPKGSKLLCQGCVNDFLARNVGIMEEVQAEEAPKPVKLQGFAPPTVESDGTG